MKTPFLYLTTVGALCAGLSATAVAEVTLFIPDVLLQPDTANQSVSVYADNEGALLWLLGINLEVEVGDGGPDAGGEIVGPSIESVDVTGNGALFESNNNGKGGAGSIVPQVYEAGTLVQPGAGYVALPSGVSKIGVITFSTLGLQSTSGSNWDLSFSSANGVSALIDTNAAAIDGNLRVGKLALVPEPGNYLFITGGVTLAYGFASMARRSLRVKRQPE